MWSLRLWGGYIFVTAQRKPAVVPSDMVRDLAEALARVYQKTHARRNDKRLDLHYSDTTGQEVYSLAWIFSCVSPSAYWLLAVLLLTFSTSCQLGVFAITAGL